MKPTLQSMGDPYASSAKAGLRGLRRVDRHAVEPHDPRRLTGSIDLEACLGRVPGYGGTAQWDYGVGFLAPDGATRCAAWLEVHNATPGDVRTMVAKLNTLRRWLATDGRALLALTSAGGQWLGGSPFRWIAVGPTSVSGGSRSFRAAANAGLAPPQRCLQLP